jgi:hypothetical protein
MPDIVSVPTDYLAGYKSGLWKFAIRPQIRIGQDWQLLDYRPLVPKYIRETAFNNSRLIVIYPPNDLGAKKPVRGCSHCNHLPPG